ncbi:MAG TPA: hypothetical protein VHX44_03420 [Planctomycetota bacterium]|nr:hypothetical protein [Planctomycetota bacterium]
MRRLALAFVATAILTLAACGGGGRTEKSFPVDQAVSVANAEGFSAKLIYFKQTDRYLITSFQFTNDGKEKVLLKNEGSHLLPGFVATCEGRQTQAERAGTTGWNPWTGVTHQEGSAANGVMEIAPGQKTELQVRWNYTPALSHKDFDWTVVISNIFQGDKKLGDLTFKYDPKAAK